jgi:hypothetical protein
LVAEFQREKFCCENFGGKIWLRNFGVKNLVAEFQREKFCCENFGGKKSSRNFSAKNSVAEIQREKSLQKFCVKKIGCGNSAKKICCKISA